MKQHPLLTAACAAFLTLIIADGHAVTIDTAGIQQLLETLVVENEIPGLNFSVIDQDHRQYDFSAGYENVARKSPMRPDKLMFSGSIGKTYAAAVVLQLVDEGKVRLDGLIRDYLPAEPWLDQIPHFGRLTVRMLLTHTTGLPKWESKPEVWDELHRHPDKTWNYQDRLAFILNDEPVHAPGMGWAYSDTNYLLLGWLVEQIEQRDYYTVLRSRILLPQNLSQTFPSLQRRIPGLAMGYSHLPELYKIPREVIGSDGQYAFNPQMEWTGGGLYCTTADLARWCHRLYTGGLISDRLLQEAVTVNPHGARVLNEKHAYGMGSFIYDTRHGEAYGHTGFMPGYNSIMAYFPADGLALALQINSDYTRKQYDLVTYLEKILDTLKGNH